MVSQKDEYFISLFLLGKYLQLEGDWTADSSSRTSHSSLLNAKRSCLMNGNCFGITVSDFTGSVHLIEFPGLMKLGGPVVIHQKETSLGILSYYIH